MVEDRQKLLSSAAQQMLVQRDPFTVELIEVTRSQIPLLDHDARMVDLLAASMTENVGAAIRFLEHQAPDEAVEAPAAAIAYARALAQRDVPLSALIRAYRIGHARFVDAAMRHLATRESDQTPAAIIELVNRLARWIDRITDQVGVAYEQERDRWVRAEAACDSSGSANCWTARPWTFHTPSRRCSIGWTACTSRRLSGPMPRCRRVTW